MCLGWGLEISLRPFQPGKPSLLMPNFLPNSMTDRFSSLCPWHRILRHGDLCSASLIVSSLPLASSDREETEDAQQQEAALLAKWQRMMGINYEIVVRWLPLPQLVNWI